MRDFKLYKIKDKKIISGVCAGLADIIGIDVSIIRLLFVIFALATASSGALIYLVLALIVPDITQIEEEQPKSERDKKNSNSIFDE